MYVSNYSESPKGHAGNALKKMVQWVRQKHPKQEIILEGYSLGASLVLLNLHSLGNDINGAVVFSPFSSLTDIVKSRWFTKIFIVRDCGWNVLEETRKEIKAPVLIFGAEDDNVIPIELISKIADEMKRNNNSIEIHIFKNGGHFLPYNKFYDRQIYDFIVEFL